MAYISEIKTTAPETFVSDTQRRVYERLGELGIPFERVDCDAAITMEDCKALDEALSVNIVKTLLLTNRQQTRFYLFVTRGEKPFSTRDFGRALECSRVLFAPAQTLLDMLGTPVGACTLLSIIEDTGNRISVVIDRDITGEEWYGCADSTTTGYMRLKTADILGPYLEASGHNVTIVEV